MGCYPIKSQVPQYRRHSSEARWPLARDVVDRICKPGRWLAKVTEQFPLPFEPGQYWTHGLESSSSSRTCHCPPFNTTHPH